MPKIKDPKLLIVEDDLIANMHMQKVFGKYYSILAAVVSGEEAVTVAKSQKPDCVLMDIHLAGSMTGIEASDVIKELYPDMPIIYCTAFHDEKTTERAYNSNPLAIFPKPIDLDKIFDLLDKLFE